MIDDNTYIGRVDCSAGHYYIKLGDYRKYSVKSRAEVELKTEYKEEVLRLVPDRIIEMSELEYHRQLRRAWYDGRSTGF